MTPYLDRDDSIIMPMQISELSGVIGGSLPESAEKNARSGFPGTRIIPTIGSSLPSDPLKGAVPDRIPVDPGLC